MKIVTLNSPFVDEKVCYRSTGVTPCDGYLRRWVVPGMQNAIPFPIEQQGVIEKGVVLEVWGPCFPFEFGLVFEPKERPKKDRHSIYPMGFKPFVPISFKNKS